MPLLGAHMSVAGGLPRAVERAVVHRCAALQIFAKNASQWRGRELPRDEIGEFRARVKKAGISNLRLYVTAQNPFVFFSPFHSETGLDPETNSYGDQTSAVAGYQHRLLTVGFNTPSTRNYLLGLNLTF